MLKVIDSHVQQQHKIRETIQKIFRQMFENTCQVVEQLDGKNFIEQDWMHDKNGRWMADENSEHSVYIDRILQDGNIFEKIGVNYVAIKGKLPKGMSIQKSGALATSEADQMTDDKETSYFATGSSFVIHPHNPMAPTAHVNYRYFQIENGDQPGYWWFGGGADLTPAYLFEEDAVHFHRVHKEVCDKHNPSYYPRFKKWCDEYFYIQHRGESRGIGGIFFDRLNDCDIEELLAFVTDCTEAFVPAYIPIVERRKDMAFTEENKYWQRLVRGRYVEFILSSDRGARFGLTSGMVKPQSVFNCMPSTASWEYHDEPASNTKEAMLRTVLQNPKEWV